MSNKSDKRKITDLAKMMRARQIAGERPYTLLLGSSLSLTPEVRRAVANDDNWDTFWEVINRTSVTERRTMLRTALQKIDLQEGCTALMRLVEAGYFQIVLTLNVDDTLDNALQKLPAGEYRVWVHGEVGSREIVTALERPTPRIKVVKLRGDVNAYELPLTPDAAFEFPEDLEDTLRARLRHDTIIVGDLPHDYDVQRCIERGDGALWVISPTYSQFLRKAKRKRTVGERIPAEEVGDAEGATLAEFNTFFSTLAEELGVSAEDAATLKDREEAEINNFFVTLIKKVLSRASIHGTLDGIKESDLRGFLGAVAEELGLDTEGLEIQGIAARLLREQQVTDIAAVVQEHQKDPAIAPVIWQKRVNPYQGLSPFDYEHAELFFGREDLVAAIVGVLAKQNFLAVLGASGSGKSSVVRAGVAPALKRGELPGSRDWPVLIIKPRHNPQEDLARALEGEVNLARGRLVRDPTKQHETQREIEEKLLSTETALYDFTLEIAEDKEDDYHILLIVDQFEEIFTQCPFEQRQRFIDNLTYAVKQPHCIIKMIITMRADYIEQCSAYHELSDLIATHQIWVRGINYDGLQQAIEFPLWRVGMRLEEGLMKLILVDAGREASALPLLQYALWRLFVHSRYDNDMIEMREYREIGGVQGAFAQHADEIYARMMPQEQDYTRRILLRLMEIKSAQKPTRRQAAMDSIWSKLGSRKKDHEALRRRVRFEELVNEIAGTPEERELVAMVIQVLTVERLLTITREVETGYGAVDISHESLIESWPRLQKWLQENRDDMMMLQRLRDAAEEWELSAHSEDYLYRGTRLEEILEWRATHENELRAQEKEFLDASLKLKNRLEREEEERRNEKLRAAQQLAEEQRQRAEAAQRLAEKEHEQVELKARAARRLRALAGALAIVMVIALLFAFYAVRQERVAQRNFLVATTQSLAARAITTLSLNQMNEVSALLARQAFILTRATDGQALDQVDTALRAVLHKSYFHRVLRGHNTWIINLALSPDGHTMATGGEDGSMYLWDLDHPNTAPVPLAGHDGWIWMLDISPDGRTLASASDDGTVRLWDLAQQGALKKVLEGHEGEVFDVAFSPDGATLASAGEGGKVQLWNVNQLDIAPTTIHEITPTAVTFSPDGELLAVGSDNGRVTIWDRYDPITATEILPSNDDEVWWLAFSPDGKRLASAGDEGIIRLWDTARFAEPPLELRGHESTIRMIQFHSDSHLLASASSDETIRLWNLRELSPETAPNIEPVVLRGHTGEVTSVVFTPNGDKLISASLDQTVGVWDMGKSPGDREEVHAAKDEVWALAFGAHGRFVASGDSAGNLWLWDTSQPITASMVLSEAHSALIYSLRFSPDGQILASGGDDEVIQLRAVDDPTGAVKKLQGHKERVRMMEFTADGRTLASVGSDGTARFWDVGEIVSETITAREVITVYRGLYSLYVAFSPDEQTIAVSGEDGSIIVWDIAAPRSPITLTGHANWVRALAFSPDGQILASGCDDGVISLWDLSQPAPAPTTLSGHTSSVRDLKFSANGRILTSGSEDKTVRLWFVEPNSNAPPRQSPIILRGQSGGVLAVTFSEDEREIISGGADQSILSRTVHANELAELICDKVWRNLTRGEWTQFVGDLEYQLTCPGLPVPEEAHP